MTFIFIPSRHFWFIHESLPDSDRELFFGPLDGTEEFVTFDDDWIMAHVMAAAGVFPSASQARKQGFNIPIPEGFTDLKRGKGKKEKEITILNKF